MYDDIDEQYRMYEQSIAVDTIIETIESCSMSFEFEELMSALDRIKLILTARYEAAQKEKEQPNR